METRLLTDINAAAEILRRDGLVAFPTETVYGLGANATSEVAIERLFHAKGRPSDNPLIVHIGKLEDWSLAAAEMTESAKLLLEMFSPGPITVILPKSKKIVTAVTGGLQTVGLRIPELKLARELLVRTALPIAAPSANISGRPSCTSWQSVHEDMDQRIDAILQGDATRIGVESTVVDCTRQDSVQVLRTGAISQQKIYDLVPQARPSSEAPSIRSPGTKHPHYQPNARVIAVEPGARVEVSEGSFAYCGLRPLVADRLSAHGALADKLSNDELLELVEQQVYSSLEEFAADFYAFLRRCDRNGIANVLVELAPNRGLGEALRDRQLRAAGRS